ncbi:hypothetical protein CDL12_11491 [Handroanthus impetiginosus]|uniref:Uncharacterized protein n=1 Tax=Handroanthus impetiginosus TaxID=429701 RepID=A0A2G9HEE6_9LAMI|nr:hypothetical protein CDL12_11491 [Handroanthus impetiginosus]
MKSTNNFVFDCAIIMYRGGVRQGGGGRSTSAAAGAPEMGIGNLVSNSRFLVNVVPVILVSFILFMA